MEDEKRITRTIGWLNNNIDLAAKISCADVMEPLSKLDTSTSLQILKDLELSSETVENPTAYVIAAARRAADKKGASDSADPTGKIARQVRWLNDNANLQKPLFYSAVVGALSKVEVGAAMKILRDLEAQAYSVQNPTAYVTSAAERLGDRRAPPTKEQKKKWREKGAEREEGEEGSADENEEAEDSQKDMSDQKKIAKQEAEDSQKDMSDQKKIAKQVGWLNSKADLAEKISYTDVKDALAACPIGSAMRILKDLQVHAESVSNPTAYVKAAAQRASGVNPTSTTKPSDSEDSKKIARQVGWLNANGNLQDRLSYSDIKEPLENCGLRGAQRILKDLEWGAESIENPTGYVRAAALRAGKGGKGGKGGSRGGAQVSEVTEEDAKKLSRQVGWLNANVELAVQISYSEVKEFLECVEMSTAMKILKDVENNAERISNPTAYIISAAKRNAKS
eukprot:TRINITY_DN3311_c0_g1_i1.p1 TRINITY_DN3311_c0_g1~~TRINITY_DN3311_c0_g1_i1.p1  ORF type:complete len:464 (-),score=106.22 TRINITY_DN3311_c0_g1_i1:125-1480(-)